MNAILLTASFGIFFMLLGVFWDMKKNVFHFLSLFSVLVILGGSIAEMISPEFQLGLFSTEQLQEWISVDRGILQLQQVVLVCLFVYMLVTSRSIFVHSFSSELVSLILFSTLGIFLVISFSNLLILFLGIEILSLPLYILAGSRKQSTTSVEASLKYFLMGSFFSTILLFGIVLVYGSTGSFHAVPIVSMVGYHRILLIVGITFVFVAFLFKAGIAPFHFWVPDVGEGTPTSVLGYMSGVTKVGTFFLLFRFFDIFQLNQLEDGVFWTSLISTCIVLSFFIANLTAIYQTKYKRMLAYSAIAQGAFMLFSLYDTSEWSHQGLLVFTVGYALALIAIFAIMNELGDGGDDGSAFQGLAKRSPLRAFLMTVSLFSLAGIPGTAGFLGKFYMLSIGFSYSGIFMVVVSVIFSAVSFYYYLRIVKQMYFTPAEDQAMPLPLHLSQYVGYLALIILIILIGFGIQLAY